MDFSLLGALTAVDEGRPVRLGGTKERALLAYLLLHANEHVSRDQLIVELWGERPPASAAHGLDVYVSRLRKLLGDGVVLATRAHGYVLEVDSERIDANQFGGLLEEGRQALAADDATRAAALLRQALSLWRGDALSDLRFEPIAELAAARLDEQRLVALELRIDAELALGQDGALVAELEELTRTHPLRERLRAQLMLALYRAGRQADALAVYRQTRAQLVEELGIEPSRELEQLEQAILRHDPTLDIARSAEAAPALPPEPGGSDRFRPALAAVAAAGLVVVGAAVAAVLVLLPTRGGGLSQLKPDAIGLVDARSHRIVTEVLPGTAASRLAFGFGGLWVASAGEPTVTHVDPQTRTVRQTILVGGAAAGIAVGRRAVWVTDGVSRALLRLDPDTHTVVQTVPTGENPGAVGVGLGSVWVTLPGAQALLRVSEQSGEAVARIQTGADGQGVAVGAGSVWLSDHDRNRVVRVDPATNAVSSSVAVGHGPTALAFAGGSLWVANTLDGTVSRIDPHADAVTAVAHLQAAPEAITAAAGSVWVGSENGDLLQLDPQTAAVRATVRTKQPVQALTAAPEGIWAAVAANAAEHRGGTLRIYGPRTIFNPKPDPAVDASVATWAVLIATNDGLTTFRKTSGSDGIQLIPDLARSLPVPSNGGKTYTVTLRRGIRYSDGHPVRALDVRSTLERVFKLESVGAGYYSSIVGAAACLRAPARCDLRRGIVVHGDSVTFHLTAPDPEFPEKLALTYASLLPQGIDLHPRSALPATGPYRLAGHAARRIELVRNPYFHQWSQAAQPDGYPDRIVIELGDRLDHAVTAVERGTVDFPYGVLSAATLATLRTRHPAQLRTWAWPYTGYFFLNTTMPPFDDVRVRRALNYALDRRAFVEIWGGPALGDPTCQILPPGLPGYRPYCPYTTDPDRSGTWHAPDLATARKLVAASGTRGQKIVVWHYGGVTEDLAREAARTLSSLGYKATVQQIPNDATYSHVQIAWFDWIADYPLPADYFIGLLTCAQRPPVGMNFGRFCDPRLDSLMKRARSLQQTDAAAANALWARIDREVVDQAAWAPVVNPRNMSVVSRRLGNFIASPVWGPLLSQMWVR